MTKSYKFYLVIFLFLLSATFFNYKAAFNSASISANIPEIGQDYEKEYADQVCAGDDNIVKAGCAVIAGQVVRGIPAMFFGASFDKVKECVRKSEEWTSGSTININDTCNQIGLYNPKINRNDFVLDTKGPSNDYSLNGLVTSLNKLNSDIAKNAFDNSYYVYKGVENIPFAKEAFAQNINVTSLPATDIELTGMGGFLRWASFNAWLTFRNVAYALIGVLSLVLGLTLMSSNSFLDNNARWRLSLEQAIPRVIISVILIQFSYGIGEALLYAANNENFIPIFNYMFGIGNLAGFGYGFLIMILGFTMSIFSVTQFSTGMPGAIMIGIIIGGLWYLYRLVIVWWQSFQVIFAICFLTIISPIMIAISLLPGEAGALQLRRYFASLISLTSQTFLYQLIKAGPGIMTYLLFAYLTHDFNTFATAIFANIFVPGYSAFIALGPIILSIVILQYSDRVQEVSNQFARNVTGTDPLGAQQQQR